MAQYVPAERRNEAVQHTLGYSSLHELEAAQAKDKAFLAHAVTEVGAIAHRETVLVSVLAFGMTFAGLFMLVLAHALRPKSKGDNAKTPPDMQITRAL